MPLYLCQPGTGQAEPWRHGIQVYAAPFPIDGPPPRQPQAQQSQSQQQQQQNQPASSQSIQQQQRQQLPPPLPENINIVHYNQNNTRGNQQQHVRGDNLLGPGPGGRTVGVGVGGGGGGSHQVATAAAASALQQQQNNNLMVVTAVGQPIRRIRHAEIVLVDDVCIAYDRYWLRLRWPGRRGGFSGYIAMGLVAEYPTTTPSSSNSAANNNNNSNNELQRPSTSSGDEDEDDGKPEAASITNVDSLEDRAGPDDVDLDDPAREETASMPPSEPEPNLDESTALAVCFRTGLAFQTSPAMKLLPIYDDGITPSVAMIPFNTEPVFCRICREGLHEDADDEQPAAENEDNTGTARDPTSRQTSMEENLDFDDDVLDDDDDAQEPVGIEPTMDMNNINNNNNRALMMVNRGPVSPHPAYAPNPHALDNPLLSPCECAGSMAFVHYLCVEQWRCRSRHPDAQNGLACETCGKPYALPPPASRPVQVPHHPMEQEDWLDAMPPHVMQALRQPHIWWRIGAAIVRRRWLRPIAPVIMSPIVALYCRARRLLKKRGVARRRWACSLCRRRARWKCVRCLRSHYCSRQCQNVSWHIVHKHVCYKPTRFWWSVVVYGAASLALFPGIFRDPLMYDLGLCLIPMSFVIMGILGGSMATFLKKSFGVDLRGRLLEFVVLLWTIWLTVISWGLVKGFFGNPSACYGAIGSLSISSDDLSSSRILAATRKVLLRPGKAYYLAWDRAARNSGKFVERTICTSSRSNVAAAAAAAAETTGGGAGCFSHLPHANADFFTREFQGEACASDLRLVVWMYSVALFSYSGFAFWKWLEKRQNQRQRGAGRRAGRVHQD